MTGQTNLRTYAVEVLEDGSCYLHTARALHTNGRDFTSSKLPQVFESEVAARAFAASEYGARDDQIAPSPGVP